MELRLSEISGRVPALHSTSSENKGVGGNETSGRTSVVHGTSGEIKSENKNENNNDGASGRASVLQNTSNDGKVDMKEGKRKRNSNLNNLLNVFNLKFDPEKGSLIGFLDAFKTWMDRMEEQEGKISDDEKGTVLMTCLTIGPRTAVQRLKGYKRIEQQLKDCYLRNKTSLKTEMRKMKQEKEESVSKWIARLHIVASELMAIDDKFTNEDEGSIFFEGLHDVMKQKLHIHGEISFEKMKKLAIEVEALAEKINIGTTEKIEETNKVFVGRITGMDKSRNMNNDNKRINNGRRCFVCGKVGHVKKECELRICSGCGQQGHLQFECSNDQQLKQPKEEWCSICNKRSHNTAHCGKRFKKGKTSNQR